VAEAWLRGPVDGVDPVLMPAAHALIGAREEITAAVAGLSADALRRTPGGAAAVGFHLRHLAGSIDRLLTYAQGRALSDEQRAALGAEQSPLPAEVTTESLTNLAQSAIDRALAAIRASDPSTLHDARGVGRKALPSTVYGLLCHIAEHTTRHTGQIIATAKIVRGTTTVSG
jgi:uncharacterized damage-inducible protein DinB